MKDDDNKDSLRVGGRRRNFRRSSGCCGGPFHAESFYGPVGGGVRLVARFDDMALPTGIGAATMLLSGWGVRFFDYDNDGDLDLLIANGHPDTMVEKRLQKVRYSEPMLLFRHSGGKWENASARSGPIFSKDLAARGMAIGDFDNDGALPSTTLPRCSCATTPADGTTGWGCA